MDGFESEALDKLQADDEMERMVGIRLLRNGKVRDASAAIDVLAGADPITAVRLEAVRALGHLRPANAGPGLRAATADSDRAVRRWAASALGKIGDPAATLDLVGVLSDESTGNRLTAAQALGKINAPDAKDGLAECVHSDPSFRVRWSAAAALSDLDGPGIGEALSLAVERERNPITRAAMRLNARFYAKRTALGPSAGG